MTSELWHAETTSDGDSQCSASGNTAVEALQALLKAATEYVLDGEWLVALGTMIMDAENDKEGRDECKSHGGDFSGGFFTIACVLSHAGECDQLGSGCTCESCTKQITDAIEM